ncbi:hypothetical protein [Seohaeicola zhoushanensis]|uniref:Uncharacterized protein n=1 Tax=Seohaeicola zhoushanensis TaxID=1569283 RepID=A0A8J3H0Z8_9RHOB|nr:hypothetical protein [Seohaeicola zhoushanensis]GHF70160.1 hypothetical protein GCM10017056_46510 [Seohaeicola zhoushanensis]
MSSCEHFRVDWRGIMIEIRYAPNWMDLSEVYGYQLAHLEVESIEPARAVLPITETGYRSHFIADADIHAAGGPVAFMLDAIEQAASHPAWKRQEDAARQYSLF